MSVITAMQEFVREKKLEKLLALKGKVEIDYDWEKEEKAELKTQKKREKLHHLKKIKKAKEIRERMDTGKLKI